MPASRSIVAKTCMVLASVLTVLGLTSLWLAYYWAGDPAWNFRARGNTHDGFNYGFAIESVRLVLVVFLSMLVLGYAFPRRLGRLLAFSNRRTWYLKTFTPWARIAFVGLVFVLTEIHVTKCWDAGEGGRPAELVAHGHANGVYAPRADHARLSTLHAQLGSAQLAYFCYSFYAMVFYSVLIPMLVVTPIYAFLAEDLRRVMRARQALETDMPTCQAVDATKHCFELFRNVMIGRSTRYVRLLAGIGVILAFEQYLGKRVMSEAAQADVLTALVIVAVNALLLVVALYIYYDGWQVAHRRLIGQGETDGLAGGEDSPQAFVRLLLKYDHSAIVIGSLLIAPWQQEFQKLLEVFTG